ncbi:MAG: iron permease [Paucimonas sp.]|nr:iron permease [Paucimonas sp.]
MIATLTISFREGLEAFLIIAISLLYLKKTNRQSLLPALYAGVALAVVLSCALGLLLARIGALSPFWEGVMALAAAVSVIYCTVHMMKMGRFMKREITTALEQAEPATPQAWMLVFLFAAFMVGREGVETATMIASLALQSESREMAAGGVIGVCLAALLALAWVRFGQRVNLQRFFQLTAVFMVVFALQLVVYAFHEFTETASLPLLDNAWWHIATEPWGPEGQIGLWISCALGILPLGWLVYAWLADRKQQAGAIPQRPISTTPTSTSPGA